MGRRPGDLIEALEPRWFLSVSTALNFTNVNVAVGQVSQLNLNDFFTNPGVDSNTVFFNLDSAADSSGVSPVEGTIPVELTPSITPATVANFLSYADSGAYDNTFIHRSVPGFVWQAGGYTFNSSSGVETIPASAPVASEYSQSNVRGTIALALSDNSDGSTNDASGTDQFFFNLADNSSSLDAQKFTVFGSVVGSQGLAVMDSVAQQQIVDEGSPFDTLPVVNDASGATPDGSNLIYIDSILHNYTVTSSNPAVATVSESNSVLSYTPLSVGSTEITVTAEGLDGSTVSQNFAVNVENSVTATIGKGAQKSVSFLDANGGQAAISLSGPGTATLEFEGAGIQTGQGKVPYTGSNLHLADIAITGATAATTLHVTSLDGQIVPITSISSNAALAGINAPKVTITGALDIPGAIRSIALAAANPGSSIDATSLGTLQVSSNFYSDVTVSGAISTVKVQSALAGSITASKINTLLAGNLTDEDLTLTGTGTSLNVLRAGYASNSSITAQGNINSISLPSGIGSTQIFAGISGAQASLASAATTAAAAKGTINSLTIGRGSAVNEFADSAIAAGTLRRISTGEIDDAAASTAYFYGIAAQKIGSFRGYVQHHSLSLINADTEAELNAQLAKRKLTLTYLTIEIVAPS